MNPTIAEMKDSGGRVRAVRKMAGHSQHELAELSGCSSSLLSKIEVGLKPLTVVVARRIGDLYGVDPYWLLYGDGEAPRRVTLKEPTVENLERANEPKPVWNVGMARRLPADWEERFLGAGRKKKGAFETGVNEFGMPIRAAFEPVLEEFAREIEAEEDAK